MSTPRRPNSLRPRWMTFLSILGILIFHLATSLLPFHPLITRLSDAATIEVYYAPEDLPGDKLVSIFDGARRYIFVAVYGITFPPAVKALVSARKRGVDVRVITDRERVHDPKQHAALSTLCLAGIPILVNQHDGLMHLKQVVVDDRINTSGSMNSTTSGHRYNDERLDVIIDPVTSGKARDKFLSMWRDRVRYEPWQ